MKIELIPLRIYKNYSDKLLSKESALNQLINLIENSESGKIRSLCVDIVNKMGVREDKIFLLLENLLISDSDEMVRSSANFAIRSLFLEKSFLPMKWALQHEPSVKNLIEIVRTLGELNSPSANSLIIEKIVNLNDKTFISHLNELIKERANSPLSGTELAEIAINLMVVQFLEGLYGKFDFNLKQGLVSDLDLSNVNNRVLKSRILNKLPEILSYFSKLEKLNIQFNRLSNISKSLKDLRCLTALDLSYNRLKAVPDFIGALSQLLQFNLKYNNLKSITFSIGLLKDLQDLDLSNNKLTNLPKEIGNLSSLRFLNLHNNCFTELSDSLETLTSLKTLKLGMNSLNSFPKFIQNLVALESLELDGNKLKQLPTWLGSLKKLKELSLCDNNLISLPESIGSLHSLVDLNLRNNKLTKLPDSFSLLKSIKKLNLSWNNLSEIPDWLDRLSKLEIISFWGNKIEKIPESLGGLKSLKIIDLNFNNLTEVPDSLKDLQRNGLIIYL